MKNTIKKQRRKSSGCEVAGVGPIPGTPGIGRILSLPPNPGSARQ